MAVSTAPAQAVAAAPGRLYVKPQATGGCTSWGDACDLQTALGLAQAGDAVWAAGGTYYPTAGTDRTATFRLRSGVRIYGGFAGTESALGERRDYEPQNLTTLTVLSGAIGSSGTADNSYHVVTGNQADSSALLQRVTVTAGNADSADELGLSGSSSDIASANERGAGLVVYGGSPTLDEVHFDHNTSRFAGGSVFVDGGGPTFTDVRIETSSSNRGGGMTVVQSHPTLRGVAFLKNTTSSTDGGSYGGGLYAFFSDVDARDVTFFANTATAGRGGGAYLSGDLSGHAGRSTVVNAFVGLNTSSYEGGGIAGDATVVNATIWKNRATDAAMGRGGGVELDPGGSLVNSIVWANGAAAGNPGIYGSADASVSHSLVEGSGGSASWGSDLGADGGGNLDADPQFVTADGVDVNLAPGSPAIDSGSNAAVPAGVTTDAAGHPRINGTTTPRLVDMGAYEARTSGPEASPVDAAVDFGDVAVGQQVSQRPGMENLGAERLVVSAVTIEGPDASQFSIDPAPSLPCDGRTIGTNEVCRVPVTFHPTSPGQKNARLTFVSNAPTSPDYIDLTGNGRNGTPVATDDTFDVNQIITTGAPSQLGVLGNDSDPDGEPLTLQSATDPAHGTTLVSGNALYYRPDTGYRGPDPFSYTVSDPGGRTATATVTVNVRERVAPTISASLNPAPNAAGWNSALTTLTMQGADTGGSGVSSITYTVDGGSPTVAPVSSAGKLLGEGVHELSYFATDGDGNVSPTGTTTVRIDVTAPDTSFDGGPETATDDTKPTFTFGGTDNLTDALEYSYRLGNEAWSSYSTTSQVTLGGADGLAEGDYTIEVRSRDLAGNVDGSPATRSFSVDTTGPVVSITAGPSGPSTDSTPTFEFSSEPGATFECSVDGAAYADCTSPFTVSALEDGPHTFAVRGTDAAGNTGSPVSSAFSLDATGPVVSITGGPSGPSTDRTPTFRFSSSESGVSFECRVDGADWVRCASPYTSPRLADGDHVFEVRGLDGGGTPGDAAQRGFRVDTTGPTVASVTPTGTGVGRGTNVRATFSEAVRSASLTGGNVALRVRTARGAWQTVRTALRYDAATRTVVLDPRANLQRGRHYRLVITTGVRDLLGNRMSAAYLSDFWT